MTSTMGGLQPAIKPTTEEKCEGLVITSTFSCVFWIYTTWGGQTNTTHPLESHTLLQQGTTAADANLSSTIDSNKQTDKQQQQQKLQQLDDIAGQIATTIELDLYKIIIFD
jgi:hypothetical protein